MKRFTKSARLLCTASALALGALSCAAQANGAITIATPFTFDNIDSCNSSSEVGLIVRENVVESLTHLDEATGQPLPRLASSWEPTSPTTWRIKLRQGVTYSDGSPFNADAVVRSIERMFNPKLDCLNRGKFFANIRLTPTVVDPYTVDIATEKPQPLMPVFMSFLSIESPKTNFDTMTSSPVGTGPYTVATTQPERSDSADAGATVTGVRSRRSRRRPMFAATNSSLRAAMVQVGEADIGLNIAIQDATNPEDGFWLSQRRNDPPALLLRGALEGYPRAKGLQSRDRPRGATRRLVQQGLRDRDADVPAAHQRLQSGDETLALRSRAGQKAARQRRAADGVNVDEEIPLISRINFYANGQESMEAMIAMWQAVGLKVKLQPMERAQWLKLVNKPYAENRAPHADPGAARQQQRRRHLHHAIPLSLERPAIGVRRSRVGQADRCGRRGVRRGACASCSRKANAYQQEKVVPDVMMFHMVNYMRVAPAPRLQAGRRVEHHDGARSHQVPRRR